MASVAVRSKPLKTGGVLRKEKDKEKDNHEDKIPLRLDVVEKLANFLEMFGLKQEGLFRVSGEAERINSLWQSLRTKEIDEIELFGMEVHDVASALKQYLRLHPDPLVPSNLYGSFTEAYLEDNPEEVRIKRVLEVLSRIPNENKPIIRRLVELLAHVCEESEANKMTPNNLGIVFGPSLMRPSADAAPLQQILNATVPGEIWTLLLQHHLQVLEILPKGTSTFRIFSDPLPLTERDWQILLTNGVEHSFQANTLILREGERNDKLYRIKSGHVRIEKSLPGSRVFETKQLALLGAGEVMGEMSFLTGDHSITAAAIADIGGAVLSQIEVEFVLSMFTAEPDLAMRFYWNLAHKLALRLQRLHISHRERSVSTPSPSASNSISSPSSLSSSTGGLSFSTSATGLPLAASDTLPPISPRSPRSPNNVFVSPPQVSPRGPSPVPPIRPRPASERDKDAKEKEKEKEREKEMKNPKPRSRPTLLRSISSRKPTELVMKQEEKSGTPTKNPKQLSRTISINSLGLSKNHGGTSPTPKSPRGQKVDHASQISQLLKGAQNIKGPPVPSLPLNKSDTHSTQSLHHSDTFNGDDYPNTTLKVNSNRKGPQNSDEGKNILLKQYVCKFQKKSGKLLITQLQLTHIAKRLGLEKKRIIPFSKIHLIEYNSQATSSSSTDGILVVYSSETRNKTRIFTFQSASECEEAYRLIISLQKGSNSLSPGFNGKGFGIGASQTLSSPTLPQLTVGALKELASTPNLAASQEYSSIENREDWKPILCGGKVLKFRRDQPILLEGDMFQRIYQIEVGCCRIEKECINEDGESQIKVLGRMSIEEIFGDVSLLLGAGATASVVADSDVVEVYVIEAEYLKRLFNRDSRLASRFFQYLAELIQSRLRVREQHVN